MSNLKVCRICLNTEVKLFKYDSYHLKQYYEDLISAKLDIKDGLPNYFCYECAAILHKFHKFKEKCHTGKRILNELLCNGSMTLESIINTDREYHNLKSSLDIIIANRRVRTSLVKRKIHTDNYKRKIKKIEEVKLPKIEEVEIDSDDSDTNLAAYKKDIIEKEKIKVDEEKIIEDKVCDDDQIDSHMTDDESIKLDGDIISDDEKPDLEIKNTIKYNDNELEIKDTIPDIKSIIGKDKVGKKKKNSKLKKFEVENKSYLDPKHWLKINLSEEEAWAEYTAKGQDPKYLDATYKCTDCYKGFSKEEMMHRHVKLKHSESRGPVECRFCKMRFKWKCFLTRHIVQHYTKFKCLRCDLMCPLLTSAVFHNEYHNGVIRQCVHCGEEFKHMSTYYTHLRTHRSEHVCTLCGASFVSAAGLTQHKRTMHINHAATTEEESSMHCERCKITFETRAAYEAHMYHSAKHVEGTDNEIPAQANRHRKRVTKGTRNPRKFTTCSICNKNFSTHTAYMKHHEAEHSNVPVPKYTERQICEICGVSLSPNSVANHLNTHTRSRTFSCAVCSMQFSTKSSMQRHQLTHTGEKPYDCSLCEKRFTQKSSMKLHYRTFHLKEPYPKRNRKKKGTALDMTMVEDYQKDDSEDNMKIGRWR